MLQPFYCSISKASLTISTSVTLSISSTYSALRLPCATGYSRSSRTDASLCHSMANPSLKLSSIMALPKAPPCPPSCQQSTSSHSCDSLRHGVSNPSQLTSMMAPSSPQVPATALSFRSALMASLLSQTGCFATVYTLTLTKWSSSPSSRAVPTLSVLGPFSHRLICKFPAVGYSRSIACRLCATWAYSSTTNSAGNPMPR